MLDHLKLRTENQEIINRVQNHPDFDVYSPRTNYFLSIAHKDFGVKMSMDFRKVFENGKFVGFRSVDFNISPHYHYNQYQHNGNDFTPKDCIATLNKIFRYLELDENDLAELRPVNLEFGINIVPETDTKEIVNGISYHKKNSFKTSSKFPYFKISNSTKYKRIKSYHKGIQFADFPNFGINPNTFRFEVKTAQFKNISKYGIRNANDLIKLNIYNKFSEQLLNEWNSILVLNLEPDFKDLKTDEVQFLKSAKEVQFWDDLKQEKNRNKFNRYKEKYYKILNGKNNLHHQIKVQILDTLVSWSSGANSTKKTPINREKPLFEKKHPNRINLEYAPPHQKNGIDNDEKRRQKIRVCSVTGIDISMQRKDSENLGIVGLKNLIKLDIENFKKVAKYYLTEKQKNKPFEKRLYYIAHNIRNKKYNPKNNHRTFEQRNYNSNQLQFNF